MVKSKEHLQKVPFRSSLIERLFHLHSSSQNDFNAEIQKRITTELNRICLTKEQKERILSYSLSRIKDG